ncbi:MAG: hypothetical protein ABI413_02220 [Ktedonobacteraceae bacterium]
MQQQQQLVPHAEVYAAILTGPSADICRACCVWCWKKVNPEPEAKLGPEIDTICPECEEKMIAQAAARHERMAAEKRRGAGV